MATSRVTPSSEQIPVNVVGQSAFGRYSKISAEKTYNMFVSTNGASPEADNFEAWMINFPGYQRALQIQALGDGRGLYHSTRGNMAVTVINSTVYQISSTFGLTTIGTLATTEGEVFIAENLNAQICIVDGLHAYVYNYLTGSTLSIQTDGALGSGALVPSYVEYHNTFFLFGNGNTTAAGAFWYAYSFSTASGATAIVQTTQLALQTKADFALAVKRIPGQGNNVMVFGKSVAEIWTNIGGLQNYQRNPTKNINYGCLSVSTIGEGGNVLAWLAANEDESPIILAYVGNEIKKISTDGIEKQLSDLVAPEKSTAILYLSDGHLFYQLTFFDPRDNLSILYDFDTNMFFHVTDQFFNFHPARAVMYFQLKTYFVSLSSGSLYELSSDITVINENLTSETDPDEDLIYDIPFERITGNTRQANSARYRINSLVLTLEQGTDPAYSTLNAVAAAGNLLITEDGANPPDDEIITEQGQSIATDTTSNIVPGNLFYQPRIDLSFSKDGGVTWSSTVGRILHPIGDRQNILQWENMGVSNDICFKFRIWMRNRVIINNAMIDVVNV